MRKTVLLFAAAVAVLSGCKNVDYSVWNEPFADTNTWNGPNNWTLTINNVIFSEKETIVLMTCKNYEGGSFMFAPETFLKAGNVRYPLIGIDGIIPGQYFVLEGTDQHDIVMHFEPLPTDTRSFDLIENEDIPGAFNIYGIHQYDAQSQELAKTHWRNVRTGDWTISIMDGFVIYDNKIWKCDSVFGKSAGDMSFTMDCDGETAYVHVGKLKHGTRRIKVDGKSFKCERFESKYLPDYPAKGRHATRLNDYGYDKVDSVTISGLVIKNREFGIEADVAYPDPLTGTNQHCLGTVGDDGRFSVTFPITNTTCAILYLNSRYATMSMPVEPGGNYFVLRDMTHGGCTYIMGRDSRLQNEYIAYDDYIFPNYDRIEKTDFGSDLDAYLDYLIESRERCYERIDSLKKVHPNLSDAFGDIAQIDPTLNLYGMIGQSIYYTPEWTIPDRIMDFIQKDMLTHSIRPYSYSFEFNYFLRDLYKSMSFNSEGPMPMADVLAYGKETGYIDIQESDLELVAWFDNLILQIDEIYYEFEGDQERTHDAFAKLLDGKTDTLNMANEVMQRLQVNELTDKLYQSYASDRDFNSLVAGFDTLNFEKSFSDMVLTQFVAGEIIKNRHSLHPSLLAGYDSLVSMAAAKAKVHELNGKYLAMENIDLTSLGNDVTPEDLANMSDGESILRKLTEPYLGRIVYIDIWGSWCHPCLENLSKAHELKEQLKDYDIVYLYLANATTDSAWKGVIKEYDLTGENCVHYNLPAREQSLIEQYLQVEGFPTYRLLNRHGALIDGNFHPSNISALKATLDKL